MMGAHERQGYFCTCNQLLPDELMNRLAAAKFLHQRSKPLRRGVQRKQRVMHHRQGRAAALDELTDLLDTVLEQG